MLATADDRKVDHNAHGWYNYFGDHPIGGSKWGAHLEGQYRRHDVITFVMPDTQQVALYIDSKTNLISKYELILTDPRASGD